MKIDLVVSRLQEALGPVGFRRRRAVWNRRADPFVDVISLQISKAGDTFTINAGVLCPDAYVGCWQREPPGFVAEPWCTVRARIGELIDGRDLWWHQADTKAAAEIAEKVKSHVLPFLENAHSPGAMIDYLEKRVNVGRRQYPPPVIYLAILKSKQGNEAAACEMLRRFEPMVIGDWKETISRIMSELGCRQATGQKLH